MMAILRFGILLPTEVYNYILDLFSCKDRYYIVTYIKILMSIVCIYTYTYAYTCHMCIYVGLISLFLYIHIHVHILEIAVYIYIYIEIYT